MKIISNKLYNECTKTTIDDHTDYSKITKEQVYDTFKFQCQGQKPERIGMLSVLRYYFLGNTNSLRSCYLGIQVI